MTWADSMATKPSGSTAERQRTRFNLPSPGSTSTMTAPARNSAKTSVTKSSPGRTNRASRVPGFTPQSASPRARRVASTSNSPKVIVAYLAPLIPRRRPGWWGEVRCGQATAIASGICAEYFASRSATLRRAAEAAADDAMKSAMQTSLGHTPRPDNARDGVNAWETKRAPRAWRRSRARETIQAIWEWVLCESGPEAVQK